MTTKQKTFFALLFCLIGIVATISGNIVLGMVGFLIAFIGPILAG